MFFLYYATPNLALQTPASILKGIEIDVLREMHSSIFMAVLRPKLENVEVDVLMRRLEKFRILFPSIAVGQWDLQKGFVKLIVHLEFLEHPPKPQTTVVRKRYSFATKLVRAAWRAS